jgi:hypothetical protein
MKIKNNIKELSGILIIKMTSRVSVPANLSRPSLLPDGYHMLPCDKSGELRHKLLSYVLMWSRTDVPLTCPLQTLSGAAISNRGTTLS